MHPNTASDGSTELAEVTELRRRLLSKAAASTTPLSLVDGHLPVALLALVMRAYLAYFRALTGAAAIELYATEVQEAALDRLGLRSRLVAYHVPWQKQVPNLARLLATSHPRPITATVHAHAWASCFQYAETERQLPETPGELEAFIAHTEPTAEELALLDQAAKNQLTILFETMVDRELYGHLAAINQSRETYLFRRLDFMRRLRDAWLARQEHGNEAELPVGVVLNPWHIVIETRGPEIARWLQEGHTVAKIRDSLYPLLERYYLATENMVRRVYVGNSRPWELRLPEILQRGRFLDPEGVVPELKLLRRILHDQPELASAITLSASPQAALFSGRLNTRGWRRS